MRIGLALLALGLVLPIQGVAQEARTYGTSSTTYLALTSWDFRPRDSSVTFQQIPGDIGIPATISRTNMTGDSSLVAPLHLPEGALVTEVQAVFCDTHPSASFRLSLVRPPRTGNTVGTVLQFLSSGAPGCVDQLIVPSSPVQIDNNANSYFLNAVLGASDASIRRGPVRVGYRLQVSPAPAFATFDDVPSIHPFFPFIEALVAAGITTGCNVTPPRFCPDDVVTRKQMARSSRGHSGFTGRHR
jgi:hypothetical protein